VKGRGRFYEETGAIRDVVQNHLLQLFAQLAMDAPIAHDVEAIRDEKTRILRAVAPLDAAHVVRGQFRGYRDEPGVAPNSNVETFVALQLSVHTWRWAGVPFFLRAGKRLAAHAIEVRVDFKKPPCNLFNEPRATPEYFRFRVGPGVAVLASGVHVKRPGQEMKGMEVELLAAEAEGGMLPYERLLGDAMLGDATLFGRQDAIEAQWKIVDPILDPKDPPIAYEAGSWGPKEADRLVASVPGGWHKPIEREKTS
jgi:glucose-6-phosphate 1-dehydrogenase